MANSEESISKRKKEHLELCSTDRVSFKGKSNGFENYDFMHHATTEVILDKIDLSSNFFDKKIAFPFLISCMTGGTSEAENINLRLAESAKHLNIGLGLGSLRYILEGDSDLSHLRKIREKAGEVPILANIGIAQVIELKEYSKIQKIINELNADSFVIHLNPVQELLQKNGQYNFAALIKSLERFITAFQIPIIVKEVGSGISKKVAKQLLEINVKGIDVAGAGGTSWAAVEILRNNDSLNNNFWDWGLPTSYCIRKVKKLKKDYEFLLIGSGGINNPIEIAKALALGADITASARIILQTLISKGEEGVTALISDWFNTVKKIMYLTGSESIEHFQKNKIVKTKDLI